MPQLKTKSKTSAAADTRDLIGKMMEYESASIERGVNSDSGRFEMLTASERQFYRAELIADYIRLSAGNMGNTQGYYEAPLGGFCSKICDMNTPSHELIGTYLAAVDIVNKGESLPDLADAVRRTMIAVLEGCVDRMREQAVAA